MSDDDNKYEALIMQRETDRLRITSAERQQLAEQRTTRTIAACVALIICVVLGGLFYVWADSIEAADPMDIKPGTTINCEVVEVR